ncbi:hypothetical protein [Breoghania sp.]|nr:hypothetical protein [Breoghania sp.]MDJ0930961.1 hypothetical protein [Breoghania sp.]
MGNERPGRVQGAEPCARGFLSHGGAPAGDGAPRELDKTKPHRPYRLGES